MLSMQRVSRSPERGRTMMLTRGGSSPRSQVIRLKLLPLMFVTAALTPMR